MTDKYSEIEIVLQRIAVSARSRGDDIAYSQQRENQEHTALLRHMLNVVDGVRKVVLEELQRFEPEPPKAVQKTNSKATEADLKIPEFLAQGPQ